MRESAARTVLLPLSGLIVWALHFTAIYAVHAFACERPERAGRLLGIPLVQAGIGVATILCLLLLVPILLRALPLGGQATEPGEREPRFTLWVAAAGAVTAGVAILFQAAPALVLPSCW